MSSKNIKPEIARHKPIVNYWVRPKKLSYVIKGILTGEHIAFIPVFYK